MLHYIIENVLGGTDNFSAAYLRDGRFKFYSAVMTFHCKWSILVITRTLCSLPQTTLLVIELCVSFLASYRLSNDW